MQIKGRDRGEPGMFISDGEINELYQMGERRSAKLEQRIADLEKRAIARAEKPITGEFVKRQDFERLQEDHDEMVDLIRLIRKNMELLFVANDMLMEDE